MGSSQKDIGLELLVDELIFKELQVDEVIADDLLADKDIVENLLERRLRTSQRMRT